MSCGSQAVLHVPVLRRPLRVRLLRPVRRLSRTARRPRPGRCPRAVGNRGTHQIPDRDAGAEALRAACTAAAHRQVPEDITQLAGTVSARM